MKNSKNQFKVNEQALINDILTNGRQNRTWGELAIQYNIRPNVDLERRRKSANDVWRRWRKINSAQIQPLIANIKSVEDINTVVSIIHESFKPTFLQPIKPKRLFYDIETSYNIVKSWRIGYNINLNMEDIIQERAIITIAYKWEGKEDVTVLSWDKGCDKKIIDKVSTLKDLNLDSYTTDTKTSSRSIAKAPIEIVQCGNFPLN